MESLAMETDLWWNHSMFGCLGWIQLWSFGIEWMWWRRRISMSQSNVYSQGICLRWDWWLSGFQWWTRITESSPLIRSVFWFKSLSMWRTTLSKGWILFWWWSMCSLVSSDQWREWMSQIPTSGLSMWHNWQLSIHSERSSWNLPRNISTPRGTNKYIELCDQSSSFVNNGSRRTSSGTVYNWFDILNNR